jgi:aminopeptidase N
VRPLTYDEAVARAELIDVRSSELDLDLTRPGPTFGVRTRITFGCEREGATTWVEHEPGRLVSVRLNGVDLDVDRVANDGRIALDGLAVNNELDVVSEGRYGVSAEGLCRFEDPEDGETYVFSHCFLDLAPRVFPCFDQPDLKAPYDIRARVPEGWVARSNGAGREVEPGRWEFSTTPPLPTYVVGIVAGAWHVVEVEHDGIPLGLLCRKAMAPHLDADELFADTVEAMDRYRDLFGPYPFPKFDQAFCPNHGGGMENAALVTLGEEYLFRSRVTQAERRNRSELIFHELAHMWFGDCVTTRWWNDLWLNEAFATYVAVLALSQGSRGSAAWVDFAFMKEGGYREDQMPTTHPVSGEAAETVDTANALLDFDGISYVKGASAIKQLAAWVGSDAFEAGLKQLIADHAFGSIGLADLLGAIEDASGRDLDAWAGAWLRTAGVATLRPDVELDGAGRIASFAIEQVVPREHAVVRPHRIEVGLFDRRGEELAPSEASPVKVQDARAEVAVLLGRPAPDLVVLDRHDLTWAKTRLDPRSLDTLLDAGVWRVTDPLVRAHAWMMLRDLVLDAELPVQVCLQALLEGIEHDDEPGIVQVLLGHVLDGIRRLGSPSELRARSGLIAARCAAAMDRAEPESDHQVVFARAVIDVAVAAPELDRLRAWLDDRQVPTGLRIGPKERWAALRRLVVVGEAGPVEIEAEEARDPTTSGREEAASTRAAIGTAEAKEEAWNAMFGSADLAYTMRFATANGFGPAEQADLVRPFVDRMIPALETVWRRDPAFGAAMLSRALLDAAPIEPSSVEVMDEAIASNRLPAGLHRIVVERRWEQARALDARDLDAREVSGTGGAGNHG